ncbi:MAG: cupin domain-containing protein [Myxococcota bacterium]
MNVRDPRGDALQPDLLDVDDLAEAPAQPRAGLREAVLSSISGASRLAGFSDRLAAFFDLARERASELIEEAAGRAEGPGWEAIPVPGVRLFHLPGGPRVAAADCGLVHIESGARFPAHRHVGDEWSFVLSGEAEEEGTGERWAPGDLVQRPAGTAHAFRVTSRESLVFAVALHGGLEFSEG